MENAHGQTPIRWLFFDLGGVLFYFDFWTICLRISKLTEKRPSQVYRIGFESGVVHGFDRGEMAADKFYHRMCELLELRIPYEQFAHIWCDIFHPNPYMIQLVKALKAQGYPLYLISNTNALHFGYLQRQFPILSLFDGSTVSYQVGRLKPDEEIYRSALSRAGALPQESVFVDDIEAHAAAARNLGIHAVRYFHGPGVVGWLRQLKVRIPPLPRGTSGAV